MQFPDGGFLGLWAVDVTIPATKVIGSMHGIAVSCTMREARHEYSDVVQRCSGYNTCRKRCRSAIGWDRHPNSDARVVSSLLYRCIVGVLHPPERESGRSLDALCGGPRSIGERIIYAQEVKFYSLHRPASVVPNCDVDRAGQRAALHTF